MLAIYHPQTKAPEAQAQAPRPPLLQPQVHHRPRKVMERSAGAGLVSHVASHPHPRAASRFPG